MASVENSTKKEEKYARGVIGILLLAGSLIFNVYASRYAAERVSVPVTDIILSNFRVRDVDEWIVYIALGLVLISVLYVAQRPKTIPFVLKSIALFIFVRSIFISLTHLGPFTPQVSVPINSIEALGLGNAADLFFSGHTGMPFLGALIFWQNKLLRYVYLCSSVTLGILVLLGHLHYSIDVFAAFFITYGIFELSKKFFAKDWRLFLSSENKILK